MHCLEATKRLLEVFPHLTTIIFNLLNQFWLDSIFDLICYRSYFLLVICKKMFSQANDHFISIFTPILLVVVLLLAAIEGLPLVIVQAFDFLQFLHVQVTPGVQNVCPLGHAIKEALVFSLNGLVIVFFRGGSINYFLKLYQTDVVRG